MDLVFRQEKWKRSVSEQPLSSKDETGRYFILKFAIDCQLHHAEAGIVCCTVFVLHGTGTSDTAGCNINLWICNQLNYHEGCRYEVYMTAFSLQIFVELQFTK